jgi:DNA ligase (NAD+)
MTELNAISTEALETILVKANAAYRNTAHPIMTDADYDGHICELAQRNPGHPLLTIVEPEADFGVGKVRHRRPMLSTAKGYENVDLEKWVQRILAAANDLGLQGPVSIKANAKLDGIAGRLENGVLASRGDGTTGNDISHMLGLGLAVEGKGDGEIVMPQAYFDDTLAGEFKHPRNVVSGAVSADNMRPAATQAMQDGAIRFVGYDTLPAQYTNTDTLIAQLDSIREIVLGGCEYPTDGLILAVENTLVRDAMGSTGHHHNWVMAAKTVTGTADVVVLGIQWQMARTGRLTPVLNIEPVELSGAVISNVTAHNAGSVEANGLGEGAVITVTRSGEVVPSIVAILKPLESVTLPTHCPCCETELDRVRDFLMCPNGACPDRLRSRFNHFFHILGTIDLFGPVACEKLVSAGATAIRTVFACNQRDFEDMGFGPGQAANLVRELNESVTRPVDDFRILAAMGVPHLGRGDSKRLLRHFPLADVPYLTPEQIEGISGFGKLTAMSICNAMPSVAGDLLFLDRTLERILITQSKVATVDSPISGKHIVFTGTMTQGSRSDMIAQAESLGAISQSSVNKSTDYLVTGEKTGQSKIDKAQKAGTTVLSEAEYRALIAQ